MFYGYVVLLLVPKVLRVTFTKEIVGMLRRNVGWAVATVLAGVTCGSHRTSLDFLP